MILWARKGLDWHAQPITILTLFSLEYMIQPMNERPRKIWEIFNIVPLIELSNATPEELDRIREAGRQEAQQEEFYLENINRPLSEVFKQQQRQETSE